MTEAHEDVAHFASYKRTGTIAPPAATTSTRSSLPAKGPGSRPRGPDRQPVEAGLARAHPRLDRGAAASLRSASGGRPGRSPGAVGLAMELCIPLGSGRHGPAVGRKQAARRRGAAADPAEDLRGDGAPSPSVRHGQRVLRGGGESRRGAPAARPRRLGARSSHPRAGRNRHAGAEPDRRGGRAGHAPGSAPLGRGRHRHRASRGLAPGPGRRPRTLFRRPTAHAGQERSPGPPWPCSGSPSRRSRSGSASPISACPGAPRSRTSPWPASCWGRRPSWPSWPRDPPTAHARRLLLLSRHRTGS